MTLAQRVGPSLLPDKSRVLLRRLYPSSHEIAQRIIDTIVALSDAQVKEQLQQVLDYFADRHENVAEAFLNRFREVRGNLGATWTFDEYRKLLIGCHFMHEYSIESAALFNPSVVPHWDQTDLPEGSVRFILSLRATGEGHISSVTFRTGYLTKEGRVRIVQPSPHIREPHSVSVGGINKAQFIKEMSQSTGITRGWTEAIQQIFLAICADLNDTFTVDELRRACSKQLAINPGSNTETACQAMLLLAEANYTVGFPSYTKMSERVLFPVTPSQSNGIEDARFVRFTDDDGSVKYYATFTAYNGRSALPQMLETTNFEEIRFMSLSGDISNKGMALFPRKVKGKYMMLSRQDDVNVLIMSSESLYKWEDPQVVIRPEQYWEQFKMGNCGSPIETSKGWLVLTHGVGSLRQYCIGVVLLDLDDPTKIVARLAEPLIRANEDEREGYVPNVVYTCGGMLHGDILIIPYAASDSVSSFATVSLTSLFERMGVSK